MKTTFTLICTSLVLSNARAQVDGLFSQKESDLKSVGQQIALLQLYAGWLEKGTRIAEQGLSSIGQIKKGEVNLHQDFFTSLQTVRPSIKQYSGIDRIIADQLSIVHLLSDLTSVPRLNTTESEFLEQTTGKLLTRASDGLSALMTVLTDQALSMTDAERMERIDAIARSMRQTKVSALNLSQETHLLSANRAGEQADLETEKALQP